MTGLEPVPVAVDERGLDIAALEGHDVAAVLVAPAHSYPTGSTLAVSTGSPASIESIAEPR